MDLAIKAFHKGTMPHSEFRSLSFTEQYRKIKDGKQLLEDALGRPILTFVPPWNSYDMNTIKALEKCNVGCISASKQGSLIKNSSIKYIPFTTELQGIKDAIYYARSAKEEGQTIIVLMHEYDFIESGDERAKFSLNDLRDVLRFIKDLRTTTINMLSSPAEDSINKFDQKQYNNNRVGFFDRISLSFFGKRENIPVYEPSQVAGTRKMKNKYMNFSLFLGLAIVFFNMGYDLSAYIIERINHGSSLVILVSLLCIAVLSYVYYKKRESIFFKKAMILTVALSVLSGVILRALIYG